MGLEDGHNPGTVQWDGDPGLRPTTSPVGVWRLNLLGRIEVVGPDGLIAKFASRTAVALLVFLACHRHREHSNVSLYEMFWPDRDGDRQSQNLRRAIADLRRVLEAGMPLGSVIVTSRGLVGMDHSRMETDVEQFLELTSAHREPDEEGLSRAIALYAGPLAPSLDDQWASDLRLELEERYGQTVERLCASLTEQGRAKEAIKVGRAAVVAAPNREDVHIALIHAYRVAGMGVEALRQFESLERILEDTWGESPSLKAREALEAACEQSRAGRHNLPEPLTSFIGREQEIQELCELLKTTRLLTLTGSGGCGKTRLSLELARRVLGDFRDGVWFVELAALTDADLTYATVARALGVAEQPAVPVQQVLIQSLQSKKLLLVLDNCEHLLESCSRLAVDLLHECRDLTVLASSREGLGVQGETLYRVPSLSSPNLGTSYTPQDLLAFEAVQVFIDRAKKARRIEITSDNVDSLVSLCCRLDGIPLAIELAAARTRSMSVEEINSRLDERFSILTGGSRTALPRHQTLRSMIDWSHHLLGKQEKALFSRLSVFAGGWTLDAAHKVCVGDPVSESSFLECHSSLIDKNLVIADEESGATRYRMLETIRYYSRDTILESGGAKEWQNRHLNYFRSVAVEAEPQLRASDQVRWLDRLEAEHENFRLALDWSVSTSGATISGLTLAAALGQFWERRGHMAEGRRWLNLLLSADATAEETADRAKAISVSARLATIQSDHDEARTLAHQSAAIQRRLGDRYGLAESLNTLGAATMEQGDPTQARLFFEEGLLLRQPIGDTLGIGQSLGNLAICDDYVGDFDSARDKGEKALAARRQAGDWLSIAVSLTLLGNFAISLDNPGIARELTAEGLAINRQIKNLRGIAVCLLTLGELEYFQGHRQSARSLGSESLALMRKLGLGFGMANCLSFLGVLDYDDSNFTSALIHYFECLTLAREQTRLDMIAEVLEGIASVLAALLETGRAAKLWGAAELLREQTKITIKPMELKAYQANVSSARSALPDDNAFDRAWQEGRALSLHRAIDLALQCCSTTCS